MDRRHLTPARRALLLVLVVLALAVRAAVPAGWMPVAGADGATRLALCPAGGPATFSAAMPGMAMPGMAVSAGPSDKHQDPTAPSADHDCPFGVAALAANVATPLATPVIPAVTSATVPVPSPILLPGRGLAAPPPPATGPPALV